MIATIEHVWRRTQRPLVPFAMLVIALRGPIDPTRRTTGSVGVLPVPAPTSPATKAVAGIGFRADTLLHFYSGAVFVNAPPWNQQNASLGMGMVRMTVTRFEASITSNWRAVVPAAGSTTT